MESNLLLTTGDFAELCQVSRELLIYYDRIGLLKPRETRPNGYRYYSLEQLYLFDAIRFLLDAGMSTQEVSAYLANRTTDLFLEHIASLVTNMKTQRAILDARIGMMEKLNYLTERALLFPKGQPHLSYWDELCLVVTPLAGPSEDAYLAAMASHSDYCRNKARVSKFPLGRMVPNPEKVSLTSPPQACQILTWISSPEGIELAPERLATRPRGNYAALLHQGGTKTIARSYLALLDFLSTQGYTRLGPTWELDINTYLMSKNEDDYLIHISLLVE